MRASVPTSVVDNTYENFPTGSYSGNIASAEVRDPNGDGSWLTLKLGVEEITPKEGTNDPGRKAFQSDITIVTDGVDAREVEYSPDLPFPIRRAQALLAGLAEGLGVAERTNGTVDIDMQAISDALANGEFAGERVGFEVAHYTPKGEGKQTRDQFNQFGPAS